MWGLSLEGQGGPAFWVASQHRLGEPSPQQRGREPIGPGASAVDKRCGPNDDSMRLIYCMLSWCVESKRVGKRCS